MNIFYLNQDPKQCAQDHVDKHVVKMILEYAQLLSTAHRVLDGSLSSIVGSSGRRKQVFTLPDARDSILYNATHVNHPSAIWVRKSAANYNWLFSLYVALMREYTYRYGKDHACGRLQDYLARLPEKIESGEFTEPTPAMPDEYRVAGDSIQSYKNYYLGDKQRMFSWKKREVPSWILNTNVTQ